ncbi:hypothetical protein F511_39246 [Dorcoceras hygrometricum]|uniref:Uncharacterized protein n=1 Tax=Dorcoceras hygrometricum TaxID=472368 RepID=A0A2Z7AYL8_9LAMI|nr:hypothetical protein F511_39246 [Dorcoceras hygrometricum]
MASDNQDRPASIQTDILRKEMKDQKAALCKEFGDEMAAICNDLLELRVESQQNFQTLSSQLSEIIAYINRGGDAKKGESSRGPQPPPDDKSRTRGGSRSEPQRKIGSCSYRGGGRMRYWLGEI